MTVTGIRKCAFTKRPISPQDKSSVVYTVGTLDANGRYTGNSTIVSVCGAIRRSGLADKMLYAEFNNSEI
ncbi:small subunit ribosomal protein S21e [Nematocida sp. AWRm77]|nr:small subunit ribosomal protein S21e [Nematocida sp. AWRm77]